MDTIFVRNVRPDSAAHNAGLHTGDRIVSVNGAPVSSRTYSDVVKDIQRCVTTLHLLVVPREEDLLQQVFGNTAHNPESNLDFRMPSYTPTPSPQPPYSAYVPQHPVLHGLAPSQGIVDAGGMAYPITVPGGSVTNSAWSSQSSLASFHPNLVPFHGGPALPSYPPSQMLPSGQPLQPLQPQPHSTPPSSTTLSTAERKPGVPSSVSSAVPHQVSSSSTRVSTVPLQTAVSSSASGPRTNLSQLLPQKIQRYDIPAQTMGVYEPVMDRAGPRNSFRDQRRLERDPDGRVYEVVQTRMVESKVDPKDRKASLPGSGSRGSLLMRKPSFPGDQEARRVRVQSLSPPRVFVNPSKQQQANQQRSASVSMRGQSSGGDSKENRARPDRVGAEGRARASSRPNSMTDHQMGSVESIQSKDKPTQEVLERIKKNVERKEEFLKRPNQPIWLPESKGPIREYHVSPQKFQKPLWPPPGAQAPPSPGSITKALSFIAPQKPDHHQLRRVKSESENTMGRTRMNSAPTTPTTPSSGSTTGAPSPQNHVPQSSSSEPATPTASPSTVSGVGDRSGGPGNKSLVVNAVPKPYPSAGAGAEANPNSRYGKTFITTLSKIQENIATPEHGSLSSLSSNQGTRSTKASDTTNSAPVTPTGSQTSLLSPAMRALPLAWVGDNERIQQLHIVSKRAKQFESGKPEREASAKTAFHRFELARLSQRGKVPNVAQRRHEFEQREDEIKHEYPGMDFVFGSHYSNVPRQRKSAELLRGGEIPLSSPSPPKVLRSMSDGGNVFPVPRRLYTSQPSSESVRTQSSGDSVILRAANRTIPVGGPRIHCEPPHGFNSRPQSDSDVLERERSHSLTSQTTQSSHSLWSTQSVDDASLATSKVMIRPKPVRQNSYLNAVECPDDVSPSLSSSPVVVSVTTVTSTTTTSSSTTATTAAGTTTTNTTPSSASLNVARRHRTIADLKDDRVVRRVSYLKATSGDRPYSDSDVDSDLEERPCNVDGSLSTPTSSLTPSMVPLCVSELPSPASLQSDVARQGSLHLKFTLVDGKKSGDRSWKAVWAVVQGRALIFYKDKQQAVQTPLGVEEQISLRGAEVDVAADYTKRRHVLRLGTPGGSQLLLQADTQADMLAWLDTLHQNCQSQDGVDSTKTSIASNSINNINNNNNNNVSPQTSSKAMRKLTSTLRTRSPTGQSPATKNRKAGSIVDSSSSPKSKTWKGRLGRQLKKIQGGSPASTPTHLLPEGATIGMCLEDCPPSPENELVPLLVTLCVGVVEERGLQTQGIYRIPGNTAAVAHLKEIVNKGPEAIDLNDTRWSDVNVISSLLKTFFRSLPDPLISSDLYPHFIEAAKIEDPSKRMSEVKRLVHELPDHHYETLRYLMMHLSRVVNNLETNKMDVKNLAIVFGPTLVRAVDDSMVTMVTDMSHQCRIVEMLISHVDWFFNEDIDGEDLPPPSFSLAPQSPNVSDATQEPETPSNHNLLLHNIHKVEGGMKGDSTKKDLVSSIISAANRKVHKVKPKKVLEEGGGGMSAGGVSGGGGGSVSSGKDMSKEQDKEGGFRERDMDKEIELRRHRILAKQMDEHGELPDPKPMSERKISSMSMMSVQSIVPGCLSGESSDRKSQAKGDDDGRLFCVVKKEGATSILPPSLQTPSSSTPSSTQTPVSSSSSVHIGPDPNLGDEVAIRTYAGLSASTQERIRRFEMETRAMLHRDKTRQRKEMEQREFDRKRLEEEWYKAKHDMESDDLLDQLADNPSEVVRKISDYSWHLQGLKESLCTPDRSSLASTSSEAALLAAALSHHNANTPLHSLSTNTTTTTTTTTQVAKDDQHNPSLVSCLSGNAGRVAVDGTKDSRMVDGTASSDSNSVVELPWLNYAPMSPHSTLSSIHSSASSGYGSLTRSPLNSSQHHKKESCENEANVGLSFTGQPKVMSFLGKYNCTSVSSISSSSRLPSSTSKLTTTAATSSCTSSAASTSLSQSKAYPISKSKTFASYPPGGIDIPPAAKCGSSSSYSSLLCPNVSFAELTPTRKIGKTTLFPESPQPVPRSASCTRIPSSTQSATPPTARHCASQQSTFHKLQHHLLPGSRHKDAVLHHILPSRLYHSPRPLRRGSSAENVSQPLLHSLTPASALGFDTQKVASNGTLKRAKASREQQKVPTSVLESGVARCGSLDSLRDGPPLTIQDDGSDLLSAITATFEEKMRSLQDASYMSPPSSTHTSLDILACNHEEEEEEEEEEEKEEGEFSEEGRDYQEGRNINGSKDESPKNVVKKTQRTGDCRLYRDPSLHRRPSSQQSSNSPSLTNKVETQMASLEKYGKQEKKNSKVKRTDSLTKSEKTENNLKEKTEKNLKKSEKTLKEKTEKRSREQTKDVQEGLSDKKPKELRRCEKQESPTIGSHTQKNCGVRRPEGRDCSSNAGRNRKNVKELKEKFEKSNSGSSGNNCNNFRKTSSGISSNTSAVHKGGKSNGRRSGLKAHLKRRHTVGGTKDLAKWINSHLDPGIGSPKGAKMSAWEHLQPLVADESLNVDRSLKTWLAKERLRTSSPDLSCPPTILLPINIDDKENLPRRHSIQETPVKPLYPLPLESQV